MKKISPAFLFTLWMSSILVIFFVVQKPDFLQILAGIKNLLLTLLIPCWMALLAACTGAYLLPDGEPNERLTLGTAVGLGILGLTGFGLAISGLAKPPVLLALALALTIYFGVKGNLSRVREDARRAAEEIRAAGPIPVWATAALVLAVLMSLAPPAEDFDALFYHLTVPAWWLRDGSLTPVAMPHYWYPQIVEGGFVFPLAFGVDASTHLIHLLWLCLSVLLLWHWTRQLWAVPTAWNVILILLTMPSLLWLASWAYTDYALTFAGLATLYAVWKWKISQSLRWLLVGGIMAGMAVSVKYTGFVAPLTGVLLAAGWERGVLRRFEKVFYFSGTVLLVACPWYLRNWIWMENPVYPFLFGGRFWDSFLAQAYSASGSGLGFDFVQLLLLPFTATLGARDMNFFDGRIGPFFLILCPFLFNVFRRIQDQRDEARQALLALGLFGAIGMGVWTAGVIFSAHLFQTRLLFPALTPMTLPLALGLNDVAKLDSRRFKISYVVRVMLGLVAVVNLFNFSLQALARNPLAAAVGMTPRQRYLEKVQPNYAGALELMERVPADARVYLLFEPRSYGMKARVQPDAINANFFHDLRLYQTPAEIVAAWRREGYTHVLISNAGANFIFRNDLAFSLSDELAFEQTRELLPLEEEAPNGAYALYKVP